MGHGERRRHARILSQLGMSAGTANHRLRVQIMFMLVVKAGLDECHVCGERIESAGLLSIEHKKPWEGRDATLFWDLDNIAFSHRRCNVTQNLNGGGLNKKVGPDGTAWCTEHKDFLPLALFNIARGRRLGVEGYCKICMSKVRKSRPARRVGNRLLGSRVTGSPPYFESGAAQAHV